MYKACRYRACSRCNERYGLKFGIFEYIIKLREQLTFMDERNEHKPERYKLINKIIEQYIGGDIDAEIQYYLSCSICNSQLW